MYMCVYIYTHTRAVAHILVPQCDRTESADRTRSVITLKPLKGEVNNSHQLGGTNQAAGEQLVLEGKTCSMKIR